MELIGPSPAFIDWWFAPWRNGGPPLPDACRGGLARRDAYRDWCARAGVTAPLPAQADWRWQAAAEVDGAILPRAAELFGGLLAARRQRLQELAQLEPARRRWCLAVALTQPLVDWGAAPPGAPSPYRNGLRECALRLDSGLPGLWSRLALLLPCAERPQLTPATPGVLRERDLRCWLMCVTQARRFGLELRDGVAP